MAQFSLTFGPLYEGKQAWEAQLEILRAAVAHLVAKDVADQLDINRSTLSDALKSDTDRRWAAEWTHVVKAMLAHRPGDDVAIDLLRRLCEADVACAPLSVTDPSALIAELEQMLAQAKRRKAKR